MNTQLNDILTKGDEQITDEDRALLKDNKDYLNEDEVKRFSALWPAEEKTDDSDSIKKAELDTYLETKRKEWEAKGDTPDEAQDKVDKVEEFLKKNGEPSNWNETFKLMTKYYQENPDEIAPSIKKSLEQMTETEQKEVADIETKWSSEFDVMAKKDGFSLSSTKEGQDSLGKIGALMGKLNNYDLKTVYEIAKVIPKSKGGIASEDVEITQETKETIKEVTKPKNPNKAAASLIGGGSGGDKPKSAGFTYDQIKGKSMSQLAEDGLKNS